MKFIAVLMVLAFPSSLLRADVASGILTPVGNVTVNGKRVTQPTAVFPGDKLQTDTSAMASITMRGTSVTMPSNSSAVFSDKQFDLTCGKVVVNTVRGVSTRIDKVIISPVGASAKFEVTHLGNWVDIFAREGAIAVDNGTLTTLEPGRMMTAAAAAGCSGAEYSEQGVPTTGQSVLLPVLIGAGIAAGLIVLVAETTKSPSSPFVP